MFTSPGVQEAERGRWVVRRPAKRQNGDAPAAMKRQDRYAARHRETDNRCLAHTDYFSLPRHIMFVMVTAASRQPACRRSGIRRAVTLSLGYLRCVYTIPSFQRRCRVCAVNAAMSIQRGHVI